MTARTGCGESRISDMRLVRKPQHRCGMVGTWRMPFGLQRNSFLGSLFGCGVNLDRVACWRTTGVNSRKRYGVTVTLFLRAWFHLFIVFYRIGIVSKGSVDSLSDPSWFPLLRAGMFQMPSMKLSVFYHGLRFVSHENLHGFHLFA